MPQNNNAVATAPQILNMQGFADVLSAKILNPHAKQVYIGKEGVYLFAGPILEKFSRLNSINGVLLICAKTQKEKKELNEEEIYEIKEIINSAKIDISFESGTVVMTTAAKKKYQNALSVIELFLEEQLNIQKLK